MFAFSYLGSNVGHDLVDFVNVAGDTAAVWFVEASPTEVSCLGDPLFLWYGGVVVVEFCDVGDCVWVVGGCL